MKKKTIKTIKFGDMPDGTHFVDGHNRKFIKLMSKTAFGISQIHLRRVAAYQEYPISDLPFNAVDYKGCVATCPDWCPFEVLEKSS